MDNLEYWDEIEGLGTFYLEMELVVSTEPVLFVCKQGKARYLFMTFNSYDGIFVFCKISTDDLLKMLTNEITMEKAFRSARCIYQTYVDENGLMHYDQYEANLFDGNRLPKVGAYYRIHSEYIQKYISQLKQDNNDYLQYAYSLKTDVDDKWTFEYSIEIKADFMVPERYNCLIDISEMGAKNILLEKYEDFTQVLEDYEYLDLDTVKEISNGWVA